MANPTWFVAKDYMAAKLAQVQATDPKGNWTAESLTKVMEAAGYKGDDGAYQHFNDFGMAENVSPNALFNVKEYLSAKVAQLNALKVDGKTWTEVSVMDAIKAAGMTSAWEHYDKFGSTEGINPSNGFNAEGYITAKAVLMNQTKEGGRADWTVAEVKAALAENGLSALEHYNLFGQAEFKAAGKDADLTKAIEVTNKVDVNNTFDPYTGVETYALLSDALKAQKDGSLAVNYAITTATDAGDVTVAQQAGLAALLAGATPAITTTPTYHLVDTVAALAGASTTVLTGSTTDGSTAGYDISDSLVNVAAGADGLVNGADKAEAKVAFTAKAFEADGTTATAATVTTVKYDDIDGKAGQITLAKADADAEGKAEIVIDASTTATLLTKNVDDTNNAFSNDTTLDATNLSYSFVGTAKADILTVGVEFASINAGAGDDTVIVTNTSKGLLDGGAGTDNLQIADTTAVTFAAGQIKGFETLDLSNSDKQLITMASADYAQFATIKTAGNDTITFSDAANKVALHAGDADGLVYTLGNFANTVTVSGDKAVTITGNAGVDTINGSAATGSMTITGGAGADVITLNSASAVDTLAYTVKTDTHSVAKANAITTGAAITGADVIKGIAVGDKFDVGSLTFAAAGAEAGTTYLGSDAAANDIKLISGTFADGKFTAGAHSETANDYLVQWSDGTNIDTVLLEDVAVAIKLVGSAEADGIFTVTTGA